MTNLFGSRQRPATLTIGSARFDYAANTVCVGDETVRIEPKQSRVLLKLLAEAPKVVTKDALLDSVWGNVPSSDEVLTVAVSHLRRATKDSARSPWLIKTVPGKGYQLIAPVSSGARETARRWLEGAPPAPAPRPPAGALALFVGLLVTLASGGIWMTQKSPLEQANELLQGEDPAHWQAALGAFEQIVDKQGVSADALAGMADAQWRLLEDRPLLLYEGRAEIRTLLTKALEIEPDDAGLHARLARLAFLVEWDLERATAHYRRALELEPENADVHLAMAQLALARGEFEASARSLERSRELNPRYFALEMAAWIYNMQRQYALAQRELERLVAVRPDTLSYHISAQSVYENAGDHDRSYLHLETVLKLSGYDEALLAHARSSYVEAGLAGVYHWLRLEIREEGNIGQYKPPLSHARYAIRSGDYATALDNLESALAHRQYELLWITVDPKYDPLRGNPRFERVLQAVHRRDPTPELAGAITGGTR